MSSRENERALNRQFIALHDEARALEESGKRSAAYGKYMCACDLLLRLAREQSDAGAKKKYMESAEQLRRRAQRIAAKPEPVPQTPPKRPVSQQEDVSRDETMWQPISTMDVRFDDIAGLSEAKGEITKRILLPRRHPEIYRAYDMQPEGGILFYGPPGTGKTMLAKAIATEIDAAFFAVRCSEIVGRYFGSAERNVKGLFDAARAHRQAIVFFDEFEALAAKRGGHSTVMNRLVPELLSQIDGFSKKSGDLLVLAATNRPWDLDSAFLRPPRFSVRIHIGLPDAPAREYLAKRLFADTPCADDFSVDAVVAWTEGFSAADVRSFCAAVKQSAIDRDISQGALSAVRNGDIEQAKQAVFSSVHGDDLAAIAKWEQGWKG